MGDEPAARAWSSAEGPVDVLVVIAGRMCARSRLRSHHPPPRLATSPATVEPNTRMVHLPLRSWSSSSVASAPWGNASLPLPASSACPCLTRVSCAAPAASSRVGARWPCCDAQRSRSKHDSCRCATSIARIAMPRFLHMVDICIVRCSFGGRLPRSMGEGKRAG